MFLTVFTPTYNRVGLLPRLFGSIKKNSFQSAEWLIVDDGSTDGTADLVRTFRDQSNIPIRYIYQTQSGKHLAWNRAVLEARGEFFLNIDSDDELLPSAATTLEKATHIHSSENQSLGFPYLGPEGKVFGKIPQKTIKEPIRQQYLTKKLNSDIAYLFRTKNLKSLPFPKIHVGYYFPESWLIFRYDEKYGLGPVCQEPIAWYHKDSDVRNSSLPNKMTSTGIETLMWMHRNYIDIKLPFSWINNLWINYHRLHYFRYFLQLKVRKKFQQK